MLELTITSRECWDAQKEEFIAPKMQTLKLEHSLVSVSKWEAKWCKPFLSLDNKTTEETLDYIRCMTLTQNVNEDVYNSLSDENIEEVRVYIEAPMTATIISNTKKATSREIITSEVIYFWMINYNIPSDYQKWHLNRLLTLINVCNIKNQPAKKMSKKEILSRNASLNAARRQALNTKG